MKNLKPKFPYSICKGDHFLRDFPGLPKVLEMCSSMSSASDRHNGDAPSSSDVKVCKKKTNVKFPCMLCEGDHYCHLYPRMDEASSLLKKIHLPTGYHKVSPKMSLVDGMVNPVTSPVNLVDQVVNLVSSSVEPLTQMIDRFPLVDPILPLENETQVADLMLLSIDPTPPLKSAKVVSLVTSLVNPTPPLMSSKVVDLVLPLIYPTLPPKSVKVIDPVPSLISPMLHLRSAKVFFLVTSSVNPTLPLKNANMVNLIPSSIGPTLPLESKPDYAHVFLVDTESTVMGGIPLSPTKSTPCNKAIIFY
jgi:hypothetical protein